MSEHSQKGIPSIDPTRRSKERLDHADAGNKLDQLFTRLKSTHPNAVPSELFEHWLTAAKTDSEFNAQAQWYAFTRALARSGYQDSADGPVRSSRDEKQSTDYTPNNAPAQKPLVKPSLDLRTRETLSNQAERANRGLLFEIFIDGKLLRDCTIAEVRAHAKKAPVQAAFFNKIVLDTKGKSGATLIGDHYVDSKKLNQMYASVGGK